MPIPHDPIAAIGLEGFAAAMRQGKITSEQAVQAYLDRIDHLDPLLGAYERVEGRRAVAVARAMDTLLAEGIDLGPLMGLPISVKDIFVIDGKPPNIGSNLPLQNRFSTDDAAFIKALKSAGCVILGTTKMVEFALGITGNSVSRGTPWNPWDDQTHRLPGGSSSGAAVALAAGLCAMSVGTDTGGSVRVPAAMCGLFGLKTTAGRWSNDGAFPLDPQTDTIGLLTRNARDAKLAFQELDSRLLPSLCVTNRPLSGIKIGRPVRYMTDNLSCDVSQAFEAALLTLESNGVKISDVDIPNVDGRERYFPIAMPAELLAWLGEEIFEKHKSRIDPTIRARIEGGLTIKAHEYLAVSSARQDDIRNADKLFEEIDMIISPTTQGSAPPVSELEDPESAMKAAMGMTRNTQPANYFDWCAVTFPIGTDSNLLPIGLQLNARGMTEYDLLDMAIWVEDLIGKSLSPPCFRGVSLR